MTLDTMRWYDELDEPPTPEQLDFWGKLRVCGRRRYVAYGVLRFSIFWLAGCVLFILLVAWGFGVAFSQLSYGHLVVGPALAWVILRWRWRKNELRYNGRAETPAL